MRCVLLHSTGLVVNVFIAADDNPAINSGKTDREGRILIDHATAEIGDIFVNGIHEPRIKGPLETAKIVTAQTAELVLAQAALMDAQLKADAIPVVPVSTVIP